jgi:hypothetical protein
MSNNLVVDLAVRYPYVTVARIREICQKYFWDKVKIEAAVESENHYNKEAANVNSEEKREV